MSILFIYDEFGDDYELVKNMRIISKRKTYKARLIIDLDTGEVIKHRFGLTGTYDPITLNGYRKKYGYYNKTTQKTFDDDDNLFKL